LLKRVAFNGLNVFAKILKRGFLVKGGADTLYGNSWFFAFHKSC
jgi:hypothetical protein